MMSAEILSSWSRSSSSSVNGTPAGYGVLLALPVAPVT
ncbi:hypothetical protein BH20ACT16_BH20ACT16_07610 [soil metagenome]|jgi:hypothetical protein